MKRLTILRSLLVMALGLALSAAIVAQESEAPDRQSQSTEEQETGGQKKNDAEVDAEEEGEDAEEAETPSLVEDILPSEMISEDLAVDFPIDI